MGTQHVGWSADCAGTLCDVVVDRDLVVDVVFQDTHRLSILGVGFADGGTVLVDGQLHQLPYEETVPSGVRRVLNADFVPGYTFIGFSGLPCEEPNGSRRCSFIVDAALNGFVRFARLYGWVWPLDGVDVIGLTTLVDGGALMLGQINYTATLGGAVLQSDNGYLSYLVADFSGPNQVGRWSQSGSGFQVPGLGAAGFVEKSGVEYLLVPMEVPLASLNSGVRWGAVDAGPPLRRIGGGQDLALFELSQGDWAPTGVAFALSPGSNANLYSVKTSLIDYEGSSVLPIRAGGPGFVAWFDGGIRAGGAVVSAEFVTQELRPVDLLSAFLANGMSQKSQLMYLLYTTGTGGLVATPGCPLAQGGGGITEYVTRRGCGRTAPLSSDYFGEQLVLAGTSAYLAYTKGHGSVAQYGVMKYDAASIAVLWDRNFATPAPPGFPSPVAHVALLEWGNDLLLVWYENPGYETSADSGVSLGCVSVPTPQLAGVDLHLAIVDGATGDLKWADCVPKSAPGAMSSLQQSLPHVTALGDGLVVDTKPSFGIGPILIGDQWLPASTTDILYFLTPPRF